MIVLVPILIYSFYSSVVLVYAVGLQQSFFYSQKISTVFVQSLLIVIVSLISVICMYPLLHFFMLPYDFAELYPILCVFIVVAVGKTVETITHISNISLSLDIVLPFCITVLALDEGGSFLSVISITCAACISFCLITVILYALRKRLVFANASKSIEGMPLLFISIGILLIILYASNISWWNYGVGL